MFAKYLLGVTFPNLAVWKQKKIIGNQILLKALFLRYLRNNY